MQKLILMLMALLTSTMVNAFTLKSFKGKVFNHSNVDNQDIEILVQIQSCTGFYKPDCEYTRENVKVSENGEFIVPKMKGKGLGTFSRYSLNYFVHVNGERIGTRGHLSRLQRADIHSPCKFLSGIENQKCEKQGLISELKNLYLVYIPDFHINPTLESGDDINSVNPSISFGLSAVGEHSYFPILGIKPIQKFPVHIPGKLVIVAGFKSETWSLKLSSYDQSEKLEYIAPTQNGEFLLHNLLQNGIPKDLSNPRFRQ